MQKKLLFFFFICTLPLFSFAQTVVFSGTIKDKKTQEALSNASISIANTFGAYTNEKGEFEIITEGLIAPIKVSVEYLGYVKQEIPVLYLNPKVEMGDIFLETAVLQSDEVVLTGSRISESVQKSPVTIQKINSLAIRSSSSGDFYEGLGNLKGIDIVTSSLGFRSFNTRGFNTTSPVRVVQFIDGMDNQAPGLNFPVGNLVGATDLDLQSIEVITGPASALYGPNAFQGVISMTTRNPYDFQGLSVQLKTGTRNLMDGQFRYAKALGKNKKFAFKLSGSYSTVKDFAATDTAANRYGDFETTQDLSAIVRGKAVGEDSVKYTNLLAYLDFNNSAFPGKIKVTAPGYMESALTDYKTHSLKLGGQVAYKIKDSLQLSFDYKFGQGTAVYQGTNRYSINNIRFHQQKLELTGKNFYVRAYNTIENAGNSYDLVFTALNISRDGVKNYLTNYLTTYFDTLLYLARGNSSDTTIKPGDAQTWMIKRAHDAAKEKAPVGAWLEPGTTTFEDAYNRIRKSANLSTGSKFTDVSSLQHVEGQYNIPVKIKNLSWIAGANFRRYNPQSFGTIFRDTLVNRNDTLADGSANLKADFVPLSVWETGGYTQASYKIGTHLSLTGSLRADKNQNFKPQFSPRASIVFTQKDHVFRLSAQSAFRIPTLQNQYIRLTLGEVPVMPTRNDEFVPFRLEGNLTGNDNLYTLASAKDFIQAYDNDTINYEIQPERLKVEKIAALRPEQVKTLELGYRYSTKNKFFADIVGYYNSYQYFIGEKRVIHPLGNGVKAGEESGADALLTGNYELLQVPVNSSSKVTSYGVAVGLAYYLGKGMTLTTNYTYSDIDTSKIVSDGIIPGFNTPKHKVALGLSGNKVWKGLGFNFNYRYQDKFYWQSTFGNGYVPAFGALDAQLNYVFAKLHSTMRIGASNVLNKQYRTAYGAPLLGRMGYISWTFDFDKL